MEEDELKKLSKKELSDIIDDLKRREVSLHDYLDRWDIPRNDEQDVPYSHVGRISWFFNKINLQK